MKVKLIWIGKTKQQAIKDLSTMYLDRLKHYCKTEIIELKELKKKPSDPELLKNEEGIYFLDQLNADDFVILLDEGGKTFNSRGFAEYISRHFNHSAKSLCFIIGGPYGFGNNILKRADMLLSFSPMTFTHDMTRVIILEQLYRAMTILKREKYHNE